MEQTQQIIGQLTVAAFAIYTMFQVLIWSSAFIVNILIGDKK